MLISRLFSIRVWSKRVFESLVVSVLGGRTDGGFCHRGRRIRGCRGLIDEFCQVRIELMGLLGEGGHGSGGTTLEMSARDDFGTRFTSTGPGGDGL